ncbi:hypothetical protein ACSSS7_000996 [Eimeria intestinalis]
MLRAEPLTKLWLSPPTRPLVDEAQKPIEQPLDFFEVRRREAGSGATSSKFERDSSCSRGEGGAPACASLAASTLFTPENLEELKKAFSRYLPSPVSQGFKGPALRILGTGSAAPSQYRNVSASIVQLTEGLMRLWPLACAAAAKSAVGLSLRARLAILLLLLLLLLLHACWAALWPTARPPLLIAPSRLQAWFALASEQMANMPHEFVSCDCLLASADEPFSPSHLPLAAAAAWTGEAEALAIRTVEVDHIPESYGVRLDFKGVSLVYSGDTRPSTELFALAANCTALLHEATFEDGLHAEAVEKKHSCIGEVLAGAAQCGCEAVILTHFSQRYPKVPQMPQSERALLQEADGEPPSDLEASPPHKPPILYAFDGIFLPLKHLSLIAPCFSLLPPVVEKVFGSAHENAHAS